MVNEGADAFKLLMARSQPTKLNYHYPIRRMMTQSGKAISYVVDKRLQNNLNRRQERNLKIHIYSWIKVKNQIVIIFQ